MHLSEGSFSHFVSHSLFTEVSDVHRGGGRGGGCLVIQAQVP